jgi:hypothetical protein
LIIFNKKSDFLFISLFISYIFFQLSGKQKNCRLFMKKAAVL